MFFEFKDDKRRDNISYNDMERNVLGDCAIGPCGRTGVDEILFVKLFDSLGVCVAADEYIGIHFSKEAVECFIIVPRDNLMAVDEGDLP